MEELKVGAVLLLKQVNLVPARSLNLGFRPSFRRSEAPVCSAGGRVFPLPSKPLPERDPQQPAEDLLPGWGGSDVHAASAAGPGEGHDPRKQKYQQKKRQKSKIGLCFVSRSPARPPPSGGPCPGCSCSLTRTTRKDGRPARTALTGAPAEAPRSPRPAGSWVRTTSPPANVQEVSKVPLHPHLHVCFCPRADDDLDELLGDLPEDTYSF